MSCSHYNMLDQTLRIPYNYWKAMDMIMAEGRSLGVSPTDMPEWMAKCGVSIEKAETIFDHERFDKYLTLHELKNS